MLTNVEMGAEAIAYLRDCLKQGNALSRALLDLPLEQGKITSFLPEGMVGADIHGFSSGGVMRGAEFEPVLVDAIARHLKRSRTRCAVFEAVLALAGDPFLATVTVPYFESDRHIYYYLTRSCADPESIIRAIRRAWSYLFIGVLTSDPGVQRIQSGQKVAPAVFRRLTRNLQHIIVGAYDGEGALIWSKSRSGRKT